MNRTAWKQERRMNKFADILSRVEDKRLSNLDAAEILGMSERTFRRYRRRFESQGLDGLFDQRLGAKSARAVPTDQIEWMIEQYRTRYLGWNVKHFYSWYRRDGGSRSYTWVKNCLQQKGLVKKGRGKGKHRKRRDRAAWPGMMLHQDGSTHQ